MHEQGGLLPSMSLLQIPQQLTLSVHLHLLLLWRSADFGSTVLLSLPPTDRSSVFHNCVGFAFISSGIPYGFSSPYFWQIDDIDTNTR